MFGLDFPNDPNGNDFDDYQIATRKTAVYSQDKALEYLSLGLCSEAGEVAGKIKKIVRGDYEGKGAQAYDEVRKKILDECGDVLWYVSELTQLLGFKLSEAAESNIEKLRDRKARGTVQGDGDNR